MMGDAADTPTKKKKEVKNVRRKKKKKKKKKKKNFHFTYFYVIFNVTGRYIVLNAHMFTDKVMI